MCTRTLTSGYLDNCVDGVGGIREEKVYAITYDSISATTATALNVITGITLSAGTLFKPVKQIKNAAFAEENPQTDAEAGTTYYAQSFNLRLNKHTTESRNWVTNSTAAKMAFLYQERTNKWWLIGDDIGLYLDNSSKGGSGKALKDFNGFELKFVGDSTILAREVSSSIVNALLDVA